MANAVAFDGCNAVFRAPEGREDISDLPLFRNGIVNVFAVELDDEERAEFEKTGRIFISILSGSTFYPIFVGSESSVRQVVVDYAMPWERSQ